MKTCTMVLMMLSPNVLLLGQSQTKIDMAEVTPIIPFVCEHGAARSPVAAAYFDSLSKQKGVRYRAIFKGTDPDTVLTPGTSKGLSADGFDVHTWKPRPVTKTDIDEASHVITLDCTLRHEESIRKPVIRWVGIPPISHDYDAARDDIVKRLHSLIKKLQSVTNQTGKDHGKRYK